MISLDILFFDIFFSKQIYWFNSIFMYFIRNGKKMNVFSLYSSGYNRSSKIGNSCRWSSIVSSYGHLHYPVFLGHLPSSVSHHPSTILVCPSIVNWVRFHCARITLCCLRILFVRWLIERIDRIIWSRMRIGIISERKSQIIINY